LQCDQYPCKYCFTSCAIRRKRTTCKPDELATTFVALQCEKRVNGLFLSSGIVPDADTTMEKMLATVERLRLKERYIGTSISSSSPAPHSSTSNVRLNWPTAFRSILKLLIRHA
jgi:predicted DNA-binding helix-hairpin-helix protein